MGWLGRLRRRASDDRGVTAVEYGLIVALIALVSIPAIVFLRNSTEASYRATAADDPGVCVTDLGETCTSLTAMVPETNPLTPSDGGTATQSITFTQPTSPVTAVSTATLVATSNSGLTVTFSSLTPTFCTVSGTTVTYLAAGTCTIAANQGGNATYAPAPTVTRDVTVQSPSGPQAQTITFNPPLTGLVGVPATLTASATSGLPVTFSTTTPAVCQVSGTTVTYTTIGTCTVNADQAGGTVGSITYLAAPTVSRPIPVGQGSQSITFTAPVSPVDVNDTATLSATASSGLTVTFVVTSSNPAKCSISGNTVTYLREGTCTIEARQAGDANWNAAVPVPRNVTVRTAQTITFAGPASPVTVGATASLSATASSGLPVTFSSGTTSVCTVSGTTVSYIAGGTCTIRADQAGDATYSPAPQVSRNVTVNKKAQTITFTAPASPSTVGGSPSLEASASSGLTVTFSSATSSICTVSGTTVTYIAGGTCTINADQAGDSEWAAATRVQRSVTVNKKSQTISFTAPATPVTIGASVTPTVSATSGLGVVLTSSPSSVCTVSGSTVSYIGAGTCTISANQPGDAEWAAAAQVQRTVVVNKKSQTITFPALTSPRSIGGTATLSATSSSGLAVTYAVTSASPAKCTISGNTVTYTRAGTCTITASQAGDAEYSAASNVSVNVTVQ